MMGQKERHKDLEKYKRINLDINKESPFGIMEGVGIANSYRAMGTS